MAALFSCGLGTNLMWCNFIGHSNGFLSSALEFSHLVNVRVFWLAGISLACVLLAILPGKVRHLDKQLKSTVPLLAASATGFFALAYSQFLFDPQVLTVVGLTVAGSTYAWTSAKYNLLMVRVLGVKGTLWGTFGALSIMLFASALTPLIPDNGVLVAIAMALPVMSAIIFEVTRRVLLANRINETGEGANEGDGAGIGQQREEKAGIAECMVPAKRVFGVRARPKTLSENPLDKGASYTFMVAVALMLATIRSLGAYGVWQGTEIATTASFAFSLPSVALMVCLLAVFAYFTIGKMEGHSIGVRFIPPIIVIFAGIFIAIVQIGSTGFSSQIYNYSLLEADVCSHLLFWCVVGASMERLAVPSFRVIGIAGTIYGSASVAWVVLLGNTNLVDYSFVAIITYGLLAIALIGIWMLLKQSERSAAKATLDPWGGITPGKGSLVPSENATDMIAAKCEAISEEYRLSTREKEIIFLLAQGRTRRFICEELVLSDNTIKTHLTHIYAKMGISSRQQMFNLLWEHPGHPGQPGQSA